MNPVANTQIGVLFRQIAQFGVGGISVLIMLGSLDPEQTKALLANIKAVHDGLGQAWSGLSKLMILLGPLAGAALAKVAWANSSFRGALSRVVTVISQPGVTEDKTTSLKAIAKSGEIETVVVADPAVAASVPVENVVTSK